MSTFLMIFATVFVAELGDKTQISTLLFTADQQHSPFLVFAAASLALMTSTALAVGAGVLADRWLSFLPLKLIGGMGFIAIGLWMTVEHFARPASS